VAVTVIGCHSFFQRHLGDPDLVWISNSPPVSATLPLRYATRPKYCLALSGGGIRSAAVALGALQALHQSRRLATFDYVTSVSGSGFAVYGLLDSMYHGEGDLDELLAEDSAYVVSIEPRAQIISTIDLAGRAIEVPLWIALGYTSYAMEGRRGGVLQGTVTAPYSRAIHRAFGSRPLDDAATHPVLLSSLSEGARDGFPYPIFVTSSSASDSAPPDGHHYPIADLFELSPEWIGSKATGYWRTDRTQITLSQSVAISAAAPDFPAEARNRWSPVRDGLRLLRVAWGASLEFETGDERFLTDGGFVDNLGISPLIARHCEHVLAIDATADPDARFKDYGGLISKSKCEGTIISELSSRSTREAPNPSPGGGWSLASHVWDGEARHGAHRTSITLLKLGTHPNSVARYPHETRGYLENNWRRRWKGVPGCRGSGLFEACAFPLESTFDQDFAAPEFRAYRLLGHYLVEDWEFRGAWDGAGMPRESSPNSLSPVGSVGSRGATTPR